MRDVKCGLDEFRVMMNDIGERFQFNVEEELVDKTIETAGERPFGWFRGYVFHGYKSGEHGIIGKASDGTMAGPRFMEGFGPKSG